jgi:RimJ/RimL family protein N-acetyltransferase
VVLKNAIPLRTARLTLEPVSEQDLGDVLQLFLGNPTYLEWTEGGDYDLEKLQRDWQVAHVTPGREMLALREREAGALVGIVEYLEHNDQDGHPWIGLILVDGERQREGFGREALEAVIERLDAAWASPVRLGVIAQNVPGMRLAMSLGFSPYDEAEQRMGGGMQRLVLMHRRA